MNENAGKLAVVISQNPVKKDEFRDLERFLAEKTAGAGLPVFITPHLYNTKPGGPVMQHLVQWEGPMVVVTWLYPRAARWMLRQAGLATPEQSLHIFDAREITDPETFLEEIVAIAKSAATGSESTGTGPVEPVTLEETVKLRWYPVVDYDKCIGCMECLDFCLFGVYGLDQHDQLLVEQPDSCRDGCPACARVCPSGAIMFPAHQDADIAGGVAADTEKADAPETEEQQQSGDIAQQERRDYLKQAGMTPSGETTTASGGDGDELDSLMDELEKDLE